MVDLTLEQIAAEWGLPAHCPEHGESLTTTKASLGEPWAELEYGCGCKMSSKPHPLLRDHKT